MSKSLDVNVESRRATLGILREMLSLPRVTVRLWGGAQSADLYRVLTRRHPRYWLIQNKVWGVALLPIPGSFPDYLKGKDKQALRTNRSRCLDGGYRFEVVQPSERLEEFLAINASMDVRQGKAMKPGYRDAEKVQAYF